MLLLRTLGGLALEAAPGSAEGDLSTRRLALLAVIGASRNGISRDLLLAIFWPESNEERARNALNQALFVLRRALPAGAITGTAVGVRLDEGAIEVDALQFELALDQGRYENAIEVYRGRFLEGVHLRGAPEFERWRESVAERFARAHAAALEHLAATAETAGDMATAVGWWQRLAALDHCNSRIALRLMQAQVAAGDPAAALRHAQVHTSLLREELDVGCDPAVLDFADQIRAELSGAETGFAARSPVPLVAPPTHGHDVSPAPEEQGSQAAARAVTRAATLSEGPRHTGNAALPSVRRRRLSAALAFAAVVVIAAAWSFGIRMAVTSSRPDSVAVLPLRILDSEGGGVPIHVRDGIAEGLINALAQVNGMRVVARTSAFQLAERGADGADAARALGVDAVLSGSIQRVGPDYRVHMRLVSARRAEVLWSATLARDADQLLELEEEIVATVTRELATESGGTHREVIGGTRNERAHALYLQGLYLWNMRGPEDLRRAIDFFEHALAEDSAFALPLAYTAQSWVLLGWFGVIPVEEAVRRARAAIDRALALDDRVAATYTARGQAFQLERNFPAAEQAYRRALQLNPNDAVAYSHKGFLAMYSGRVAAGLADLERAHQLDPLSVGLTANVGWGRYFARRHTDAVEAFARILQLDTLNYAMHNGTGRAMQQLGRREEALASYRRAVELGGTAQGRAILAHGLAHFGEREEAERIRAALRAQAGVDPFVLAIAETGLGDLDAAFAALEQAVVRPSPTLVQVTVDPLFDPLRNDPRFAPLLQKIRTPREQPGG